MIAVKNKSIKSVKFFAEKMATNLVVACRAPAIKEYCQVADSRPEENECFVLLLAIHNQDLAMLKYLWEEHAYIWDNFHLCYVIEWLARNGFVEGIKAIIKSEKAQDIFLGMNLGH